MQLIKTIAIIWIISSPFANLNAQSRKNVDKSTDILMFAPPVAGFVTTLAIKDYDGTKQIVEAGLTNLAVTYILKYSIKKERPNHEDNHSFPSSHTSIAFQGASFIQKRYGWKFGAPAYAVSMYVAWGRIYAKQHDLWDVLAGAAIGTASSYIFTRPFSKKYNLVVSPVVIRGEHPGIYASILF